MIKLAIDLSLCGAYARALGSLTLMHELDITERYKLADPYQIAYFRGFFMGATYCITKKDDVFWIGQGDFRIAYRKIEDEQRIKTTKQ